MNVRFFNGSKADYERILKPNPTGLYFCTDSHELFFGDMLLSDGLRVVPTFADLPSISEHKAAEGIIYFVEATKNGYVLPPNGTEWLQVISDTSDFITLKDVERKGYLTEHQDLSDYVKKTDLPAPDLFIVDFTAPDFNKAVEAYISGKLLLLRNATPDVDSYAMMSYISAKYITFTKFLLGNAAAYGAFNNYYLKPDNTWEVAEEVRLNRVETFTDNTGVTVLHIGKDECRLDYATNEYIQQQNFVTDSHIKQNYTTTEQLQATYTTNEYVNAELAKKADVNNVYTKNQANLTFMTQDQVDARVSTLIDAANNEDSINNINDLITYVNENADDIAKLITATNTNTDKLANIDTTVTAYITDQIAAIVMPKASTEITLREDGVLGLGEVSTDKLVQGINTIVLNGGSAIN